MPQLLNEFDDSGQSLSGPRKIDDWGGGDAKAMARKRMTRSIPRDTVFLQKKQGLQCGDILRADHMPIASGVVDVDM
jgi:hypothetical protein